MIMIMIVIMIMIMIMIMIIINSMLAFRQCIERDRTCSIPRWVEPSNTAIVSLPQNLNGIF